MKRQSGEATDSLRVLLVEDHALVRAGFRSLLSELPGIEVVAEATDGHEAIRAVDAHRPHVILMDISLPGMSGLDATRKIVRDFPGARVLILSVHVEEEWVIQALRAGASGYLVKEVEPAEFERAVRTVGKGETYLSGDAAVHALRVRNTAAKDESLDVELTGRQRQILQLIGEGLSTRDIAGKLSISQKTVENHRTQLMHKLGVHNLSGLVRAAVRLGMVEP